MNRHNRSILVLLFILFLARPVIAADGKALAPFLDDRTVAVLAIELDKVDVEALAGRLATLLKLKPDDLVELKKEWSNWLKGMTAAGGRELYVVASLADYQPFVIIPLQEKADIKALSARLAELKRLAPEVEKIGTGLVMGEPATLRRLRSLRAVDRPDIRKALAGAAAVRVVLVPTNDATRILEETLPTLPEEVGGGSIRPLSRGLRWLALDVQTPKLGLRLTVQAADADAARAIDELVGRLIKALGKNKHVRTVVKKFDQLVALWKPRRTDDRLELSLDEKVLGEGLRPFILELIAADRRERKGAQVREIVKAMHDYEAKHGHFPAHASYDRDGKSLLSWRVHILPHLGEEKLYKEFRLNEPWDSPHNKKLIARMPAVYRMGGAKGETEYRTTLLVPVGEATMFPGRRGVRIREVVDGLMSTIILVDAANDQAVVWTRPMDLVVDKKDPAKGLAKGYDDRIMVATADGSVHFLRATTDATMLWGLFTRGAGDVGVPLPK